MSLYISDINMSYGLIYNATNIQNKKVYIGFTTKTLDERKQKHIDFSNLTHRRRSYFHDTIKSIGIHNFKWYYGMVYVMNCMSMDI